MFQFSRIGLAALVVFFACAARAAAFQPPPKPLVSEETFRAARDANRKGGLLVVVIEDWKHKPGPEWKDPRVAEWIASHGTIVQYEKGRTSTTNHAFQELDALPAGVHAYKRGSRIDADAGPMTPEHCLQWLALLDGPGMNEEFARARAGERHGPASYDARIILAQRLERLGLREKADAEYAWVRADFLCSPLPGPEALGESEGMFGPEMPPDAIVRTMQAMKNDPETVARIRGAMGPVHARLMAEPEDPLALGRWWQMNAIAPDADRTLAWYEAVRNDSKRSTLAHQYWDPVFALLASANRWADAGRITDNPVAKVNRYIRDADMEEVAGRPDKEVGTPGPIDGAPMARQAVYHGSLIHAAMLAAGREDDARLVHALVTGRFTCVETRYAMLKGVLRAKQARAEHLAWADAAQANAKPEENLRALVESQIEARNKSEGTAK